VLTLTGFAAVGVLESAPLSLIWPIAVVAALMLTFVSTLIHELAHAAAAGWLGADINKIVVLPFEFSLGQRRLRLVGRAGKGDLGGYVAYKLDRIAPRRKHAIIAVSGPVANLVTGLAAGWMAQSVSIANAAISAGDYRLSAAPLAMAFAMLSVGMGIGNLIPFDQSDGMRIWRYFRPVAR
jgi:Zn-dependent protease